MTYLVFDVLQLDGRPLLDLEYSDRRALLDELGLAGPYWQTPPSFPGEDFPAVQAVSVEHGMEGVVAKRLDSRYLPGSGPTTGARSRTCRRQEAVVAGYKPGKGNRTGQVGSLLIGVNDASGLIYAGHVGTGFSVETLRMLGERLRAAAPSGLPVRRAGAAGACPHRRLGRAPAGDRGDLRQVDQGGPDAGAGVQGPARRQGPRRRDPGAAVSPDSEGRRPGGRADADADQPRQGPVPGERVHQGRGARLLPAGGARAAAAHRGPAADAEALSRGRGRRGLLPEARHRAPAGLDPHRPGRLGQLAGTRHHA